MKFNPATPVTLLAVSFLISCGGCSDTPKKPDPAPPAVVAVSAPVFNEDSAYSFIEKQCAFGPRVPNTAQHAACASYLISTMRLYCDTVLVQKGEVTTFNKVRLTIQNIIGRFNPESRNRVLLFAHWDTRPWADQDSVRKDEPILGADDAASGVAVLMEVARQLSAQRLNIGVDIIFFDAEDYGARRSDPGGEDSYALGTQYWCRNLEPPGYTANFGILLDMVGARGARFYHEGYSVQYASSFVDKIWAAASRAGFSSYFPYARGGYVTDDHVYPNQILNLPCVDIINSSPGNPNSGFASHWHTHRDNLDIIDKNTLKAVGQTLLEVLYHEPGA